MFYCLSNIIEPKKRQKICSPNLSHFFIFQPGSGQLLSNFVIFSGKNQVYDIFKKYF